MVKVNITLPEKLKAFLDDQVASHGYVDASTYVQNLLRQARAKADVETKLIEGIDALEKGDVADFTKQDWQRIRTEFRQRHKKARARKAR